MSSFDTKSSNSRSQEVKGHTHKDRVCLRSEREIPWYQLWTYSGVNTTIEIANSEGITEENIGHLSSENSRKYHANRFKEEWVSKEDKTEYSLVVILLRLYKKPLIITTFVFWFCVFLEAVNFHVLSQVLSYVEGENNDQLWAITCAISMAILEFISRGLDMIQNGYLLRWSATAKSALEGAMYSKIFNISEGTNKKYTKAKIQNLIDQDASKIGEIIWDIPRILSMPMLIIVTFYSLYQLVGYIVWVPFIIMLLGMVLVYFIIMYNMKIEEKRRRDDDDRSTIMNEIIENIKVLKMNSWINCFENKLNELRRREHKNDLVEKLIWMPEHASHWFNHYLMILSVLMICILGYGMKVTIPVAVVIVKLLGKIKFHTELVPEFANTFSEFQVSVRRIVQFLNSPEIESHLIEVKNARDHFEDAIEIKKSSFFWGFDHSDSDGSEREDELDQSNEDTLSKSTSQLIEGENNKNSSDTDREEYNLKTVYSKITLKDIELKIPKGELVAIIGDVGSGKSSLINTLLGETLHIDYNTLDKYGDKEIDSHLEESINIIKKSNNASLKFIDKVMQERNRIAIETSPKIYITGSISLVQQKPFILSQTIRDNILFGEELNNDRYNRVVEASQLGRDLEILEGGDLTQIGEKGVNLSGGQKARLSIARAVYSNRDIILMDDPLSALDAHVKKAIFDEVCCKELRDRTRIIVTHAVDFLDRVDRIIVFENGKIKLNGTFEDIKEEDYFKEIIKTKTNHEREDEEEHSNASEDTSEIEEAKKNHLSGKEKKLLEDIDDKEVNVSSSTYLSYFMYLKQGLIFIAIGVIIRVLVRVGHMQSEYLILKWVKDFSSTEIPEYESLKYISLVVVSTIAIDLFSWVVEVIQNYMIDKKMFQEMFDRVLNAPINLFFDKMPSTLITKRFTSDLNCSSRELPHTIKWNLRNLICMWVTVSFVIYSAPSCFLVIPLSIFFFFFVIKGYTSAEKDLKKLERKFSHQSSSHFGESVEGASTIRAYKKIGYFEDIWFELQDKQHCVQILTRDLDSWMWMRLMSISIIFIAFLYTYCVIYRDSQDTLVIGMLMGYVIDLQWDMSDFTTQVIRIQLQMASFYKCKQITEIPQEADQRLPIPIDQNGEQWISNGRIQFKNFSLRYRPDTEIVLKNINLNIEAGEKIGIVGRTGAGKSSLCLALWRIIEALEGSIEIDGVDISKVGLADLRDRVTVVPQESVLFKNTLRFNLDPEHKCSDQELKAMLHKASLENLLARDGNGLNFKVAEKGTNLSAGEKALVWICRAALRKNKVVIMDEATASIDVNTEETIQKLLAEEFADSTVITVAHRLNTVMKSDKIVVMSFGEVIEFGNPDELLKDKKSHFTEMMNRFNQ